MTRYLLDTHVVLWVAENSPKLSEKVNQAILNTNSEKHVSIISAWEVALKLKTKKLQLAGGLQEFYKMIDENGFHTLSLEREHLLKLPDIPNYHKDTFDRLLIASALAENMVLITADDNMRKYDVPLLW